MAWPDFFALCLGVGFAFSLLSVLSGAVHVPHIRLHWGHGRAGHGAFSPITLAAFLMWFGASGYLLSRFASWRLLLVLGASTVCGLVGGAIVFAFMTRVLLAHEKPLDPADYEMPGVLGRVSSAVRPDGTGEMIFTQHGRRCGVPVRSETGAALALGTEVVVTRYESGIAYVKTWEELDRSFETGQERSL